MKKAIKKTCVVLLLFALLVSQVAASYSETGTLNEGTSAISAAERYLSNWAYNSYMYADKNLTLGTVLDAEVEPAKLTLATSEIMALRNDADGQENNISVAVSKMQANIQFMIDKATYFSTIRQYNGLQRTDFNTDYVVQRVDVQGNFAVIEVLENISFQYVGAEDSSFSQKEHTVSLIKVEGEWIVANVETKYDWFANEYKDTEYKISSIIAAEKQNIQAQAECSANEDSVVSAAPAEDEMVAEVLANASFARMYNKENAWKYAYTYATSTTTSTANSYYNTDIFNDYSGPDAGDCMNFASQAIYAGFSGSNNLTSVNAGTAPQDTVGIAAGQTNAAQTKWYAKPASTYWAWTSCGYFRDYIDYSINDTETRLRAVKKPITASSDFSEVGTANLIGSIIHVNGSKPLGHAVIVNNATGTARNQIYFTAHSPNAKNLNLADEYSGQMVSIRPTYFYDVTTCTGANTSHTFSSTNSKCARCGYVRTYIIPTLLIPMAKNTQITLTARTNHTVSSISMSVKNPNGATTNLGTVTNTNSISKVYTPTVAAHPNDLYTVTVTAVSADGVTTSSTWTFRTY